MLLAENDPLQNPETLYGNKPLAMKRVYVAQNQLDAQLVAEELRADGITAIVKVDTVAAPSIPFPSVWVEERDLPRAQELLTNRSGPSDGAV